MFYAVHLVLFVLAAGLRIGGMTNDVFKDIVHIYMGVLGCYTVIRWDLILPGNVRPAVFTFLLFWILNGVEITMAIITHWDKIVASIF